MFNEYCQYLLDLVGHRGDGAVGHMGNGHMGNWHILAHQLNLNHLSPHRAIFSHLKFLFSYFLTWDPA